MLPQITAFDGEEHHAFTLNGGRPAALLIHGFPGTPDEMRPLAQSLHAAGWTTRTILLPGFGPEINDVLDRGYEDWRRAVHAALHELRQDHGPVLVIGNSMGGALAVQAAAQVGVDGLVLLAPFYRLNHVLWTLLPALKVVFPRFRPFRVMKPNFDDPEFREGILNFMPDLDLDDPDTQDAVREFAVPVRLFAHIRKAGQMAYRAAPKIEQPALVIQGRQDNLVNPENTGKLIKQLRGPVNYLAVEAEHDLVRDDRPAWSQVEEAVLQFAQERVNMSERIT